ncbi:hypothetical protein Bhyg_12271 [Pseudolycoriella hygida]|uniref:Uncharacterized protein n=1 Tax=Pseudolycoriella hygida TaxID=35572 RepID=A0A9Q0RZ52_9DIPT|nr:hypothetical protein Bhyg_12271 [Pseudolycoriella hygida]
MQWQCTTCIDDFNGLWTKLEGLTDLVNEIKSMINLCGLVKSTVVEALSDSKPIKQQKSPMIELPAQKATIATQPLNVPAPIDDYGIRLAEKRSYLWLSGFHHTSTTQQVSSLVSKVLGIQEKDIICRSLKSGKRDYSDFNHISFRIGLKSSDVKDAFEPNKCPVGIIYNKMAHKSTTILLRKSFGERQRKRCTSVNVVSTISNCTITQ